MNTLPQRYAVDKLIEAAEAAMGRFLDEKQSHDPIFKRLEEAIKAFEDVSTCLAWSVTDLTEGVRKDMTEEEARDTLHAIGGTWGLTDDDWYILGCYAEDVKPQPDDYDEKYGSEDG